MKNFKVIVQVQELVSERAKARMRKEWGSWEDYVVILDGGTQADVVWVHEDENENDNSR